MLSILLAAALLLRTWDAELRRVKPIVPAVYQFFWNRFVTGPQPPWVIFSNGSFVGRPETGMRYFNASADSGASSWITTRG